MATSIPTNAICLNCRWFHMLSDCNGETVLGHCCRHAPTAAGWPVTRETQFCGDWENDWTDDDYNPVPRTPHHWSELPETQL